jgi:hypothetical protein
MKDFVMKWLPLILLAVVFVSALNLDKLMAKEGQQRCEQSVKEGVHNGYILAGSCKNGALSTIVFRSTEGKVTRLTFPDKVEILAE